MAQYEFNVELLRLDDEPYELQLPNEIAVAILFLDDPDYDRVSFVSANENDETIVVELDENDPIAIAQFLRFVGFDENDPTELDFFTRIA